MEALRERARALRRRLADLHRDASGGDPLRWRDGVGELVVVASSSRGGSSVFTEFLRRSGALHHLRAELNAFLALDGLTWPESGTGSDALGAEHAAGDRSQLLEDLRLDCGNATTRLDTPLRVERFQAALTWRLFLQWPHLHIEEGTVAGCLAAALARLRREAGWDPGRVPDAQPLHAAFLAALRRYHPEVNPHYYDLSRALIAHFCPSERPSGPPGPLVLEEPPFVTISPWELPDAPDRPLVIKTPSNAYRLPFFAALFPRARLRVLHLTRNAAAAINGLYDGWRYGEGFHAHHLPQRLSIDGYTDAMAGGRDWWKYDLPPGWERHVSAPLELVCAYQWRAAHGAALDFLEQRPEVDRLRARFEDLTGDPAVSQREVRRIAAWLGAPDPALTESHLLAMPPVMSTDKPRNRRWFEKALLLEPVLQLPATRAMMERLGYDPDPHTWT